MFLSEFFHKSDLFGICSLFNYAIDKIHAKFIIHRGNFILES